MRPESAVALRMEPNVRSRRGSQRRSARELRRTLRSIPSVCPNLRPLIRLLPVFHAFSRPMCTKPGTIRTGCGLVFPTPVGVFPMARRKRRDEPRSSPRPWGCFSARPHYHAIIFGLPHARGGVSLLVLPAILMGMSSPRPWGCFHVRHAMTPEHGVFPTPVGVFPHHQTPIDN